MKRTLLAQKGTSDTSLIKQDIQDTVRGIVIIRDGGCIARDESWHTCSGYRNDGELILQADHLLTRANSATYINTRLIVCICVGLHGWKYNERIRPLQSHERVALWNRCHAARYTPTRMYASAALKQELANTQPIS